MCDCEPIYSCIGTKKLLKFEEKNDEDNFYLKCASCEKYRQYHSQNYIICYFCANCYCKGCHKDRVEETYQTIRKRENLKLGI